MADKSATEGHGEVMETAPVTTRHARVVLLRDNLNRVFMHVGIAQEYCLGSLRPSASRQLPTRALAERLPKAISRGSQQVSGRAKPLLLSVNELVDRSGFEPLTSAVQRRRSPN